MRKKVYICSPYRGNTAENVANALSYCTAAVSVGVMPIAPHIYFTQFLDDDKPAERLIGMNMACDLLIMCDEVWVFGVNALSEGMSNEVELAQMLGKPVKDGFEELAPVLKNGGAT